VTRVSEGVARPVRGTVQGGLGYLITDCLVEFNVVDLTERQYGLSVLVLGIVACALQNFAENKGWIKAFLRQVPPTEVPVVDPT
jgi:hypothetical protein